MTIADKDLQVLDYIAQSSEVISKLDSEKKALQHRVDFLEGERVRLEKVASRSPISKQDIDKTLDILSSYDLIDVSEREKLAASIASNPKSLLELTVKIAHNAILSEQGYGVAPEFTDTRKSDKVDARDWIEDNKR
jgi:hypothetical protein